MLISQIHLSQRFSLLGNMKKKTIYARIYLDKEIPLTWRANTLACDWLATGWPSRTVTSENWRLQFDLEVKNSTLRSDANSHPSAVPRKKEIPVSFRVRKTKLLVRRPFSLPGGNVETKMNTSFTSGQSGCPFLTRWPWQQEGALSSRNAWSRRKWSTHALFFLSFFHIFF